MTTTAATTTTTSESKTSALSSSQLPSQLPQHSTIKKVEHVSLDKVYKIGDQAIIWNKECTYKGLGEWSHPNYKSFIVYVPKYKTWLFEPRMDDMYGGAYYKDEGMNFYDL